MLRVTAEGVVAALELVAPGGRVVLYGVYPRPVTLDANQVAEFKELTVVGGHLAPGQFPDAVALLATAARPASSPPPATSTTSSPPSSRPPPAASPA